MVSVDRKNGGNHRESDPARIPSALLFAKRRTSSNDVCFKDLLVRMTAQAEAEAATRGTS